MSMNVYFSACREVLVISTGMTETQTIAFWHEWQTPTEATKAIIDSADPVQAYRDWVLAQSNDQEFPVYAADDIFQERDPIRVVVVNLGKDHVAEFDAWIKGCEGKGYTITAEMH